LAFLQASSNVNGSIRIFSHRSNYEILSQISIRSNNLLKKKFLYRDQSFLRQSDWVPAKSYNLYAPGSAPFVFFEGNASSNRTRFYQLRKEKGHECFYIGYIVKEGIKS